MPQVEVMEMMNVPQVRFAGSAGEGPVQKQLPVTTAAQEVVDKVVEVPVQKQTLRQFVSKAVGMPVQKLLPVTTKDQKMVDVPQVEVTEMMNKPQVEFAGSAVEVPV